MCQDFISLIDDNIEDQETTNISKIKYLDIDKEKLNPIENFLIENFRANRIY
jgi:hypothetical protein